MELDLKLVASGSVRLCWMELARSSSHLLWISKVVVGMPITGESIKMKLLDGDYGKTGGSAFFGANKKLGKERTDRNLCATTVVGRDILAKTVQKKQRFWRI